LSQVFHLIPFSALLQFFTAPSGPPKGLNNAPGVGTEMCKLNGMERLRARLVIGSILRTWHGRTSPTSRLAAYHQFKSCSLLPSSFPKNCIMAGSTETPHRHLHSE